MKMKSKIALWIGIVSWLDKVKDKSIQERWQIIKDTLKKAWQESISQSSEKDKKWQDLAMTKF